MRIGVVGCGNISDIYLQNLKRFKDLSVVACSDLDPVRAKAKAEAHGVARACTTEQLLADPEVELVLNLTRPQDHVLVSMAALEAGKHVYSEKPLALNREDGRRLLDQARGRGVRLGCAPDTFMGASIQTCRKIIDSGEIGSPVAGCAFMLCRGHESWHPAPDFYYQPGGGPVFDMGPYYFSALVNLVGPFRRVTALARATFAERTITSEALRGQKIAVNTPTHLAGVLEAVTGALITFTMSFDVWSHTLPPIEVYCTDGSLCVPDPNNFAGLVRMRASGGKTWRKAAVTHGYEQNSRGIGVLDMVRAIRVERPHRASADVACHVLDIMEAILDSARENRPVELTTRCEKPARMPQGLEFGQMDD